MQKSITKVLNQFPSGLPYIEHLCNSHDIIVISEHWCGLMNSTVSNVFTLS